MPIPYNIGMEILGSFFDEHGDHFFIFKCENGHIYKRPYRRREEVCPHCHSKPAQRCPLLWEVHPREYLSWQNMKYFYFGNRRTIICERWLTFSNFLEDMGEQPQGTFLERINKEGNFEPGNCRWGKKPIRSVQSRSQRSPREPKPKGQPPKERHPLYRLWLGMKSRCLNVNNKSYPRYGGRGIKVCERWMTFANFVEDMGERPPGTSLDRINNDGNYELSNCRWATVYEQSQNRSTNRNLTVNGETYCLSEWSRRTGINPSTIKRRKRAGYTDEEIFAPLSKCFKPQMVERESG